MKKYLFLLVLLFTCGIVSGKVRLPEILSGNMVLQQNTSVKLWGKAKPNARITVSPSWSKKVLQHRQMKRRMASVNRNS